jgi:excisionase family DNA binding protein
MSNTEKVLLTVSQAAERLNLTRSCLRRWILERRVATVKLGRLVRVPASEVDRLIATGLRPARPTR